MSILSPEWETFKRDAQETPIEEVAEALGLKLRRQGRDLVGHCPAGCTRHGDGFVVSPRKGQRGLFLCRPSGETGDNIDMVMHASGVDFVQACEIVNNRPRPDRSLDETDDKRAERVRRSEERARRMAAQIDREEKEAAEKRKRDEDQIELVLRRAVPIAGTQAEAYLVERGATPLKRLTIDLLFVPDLDYWGYAESDDDYFRSRPQLDPTKDVQPKIWLAELPAMVARVRDVDDGVIALHQTFLDPAGEARKWKPAGDANRNGEKKFRGSPKGGLIRLGMLTDRVAIGEGIESTLGWYGLGLDLGDVSLAAAGGSFSAIYGKATGSIPHPTLRRPDGRPVWIVNGVPDMTAPAAGLRDVTEITLLGDGDSERQATRMKTVTAARRLTIEGRLVTVHMAPNGADWGDVAQARAGKAVAAGGGRVEFIRSLETAELPPIVSAEAFIAEAEAEAKPFKSKFGALFLDALDDPGPEHEWLIDGILSLGDKSVMGGPSKSGKSFLMIHAGLCIAHGRDFFGLDVLSGLVIYQVGEGARGAKKRLRAWRQYFGVAYSRETPFVLLQNNVDLYSKDGDTKKLIEEIRAIQKQFAVPLRLVVFDTLATAAVGAEENSAKDIGLVFGHIAEINAELGCHVALVHHMNASGEKLRGSTAIFANIDQTVYVTRDETTKVRTVRIGKQRDEDDDAPAWQFELKRVEILDRNGHAMVDRRGKPVTSCVCLPVGEKEANRRSEEMKGFVLKAKGEEEPFLRAYFECARKWGQPVPPSMGGVDPSIRTIVDYETVKRHFVDRVPDDEPPPVAVPGETIEAEEARKLGREKKRRQRLQPKLKAVRESLVRYGVIGFTEHQGQWFVWWTGKAVRGFAETQPPEPERERYFGEKDRDDIPF
jgi:hypothetical protein